MRVAVLGASGFVGTAVVNRLVANGRCEVRPVIHSSANAWRLARTGMELQTVDLMSRESLRPIIAECTHVVNCTRGPDAMMIEGLENLLAECKANKIARFVHLSSVAVYGDPPPPETAREDGPTSPAPGSYGWMKLQQDKMVFAAHRDGLPSAILCPPNIGGPYSSFLLQVLNTMQAGQIGLLDDGRSPCNLVDVENLAYAVELALARETIDGRRYFITDDSGTTWRDLIDALALCIDRPTDVLALDRDDLVRRVNAQSPSKGSILRSLKHLVSSDVRAALRKDPLIAKADVFARSLVARLPKSIEDRVRLGIEGPDPVPKINLEPSYHVQLCSQQLRMVRHSCDAAKSYFGYQPPFTTDESMDAFRRWYRSMRAIEKPEFALLDELATA